MDRIHHMVDLGPIAHAIRGCWFGLPFQILARQQPELLVSCALHAVSGVEENATHVGLKQDHQNQNE